MNLFIMKKKMRSKKELFSPFFGNFENISLIIYKTLD